MNALNMLTCYNAKVNDEGQLEVIGDNYYYAVSDHPHPVLNFFEHLNKRFDNQEFEEWLRLAMSDSESINMAAVAFITTSGNYYFVGCAGGEMMYAISADLSTTRQVVAAPGITALLMASSLVHIAGFIQLPVFNTETHMETVVKLPITEINDALTCVDGLLLCPHVTETDKGGLSGCYHPYSVLLEGAIDSTICVNGNITMMIPNQDCRFDFV